MARKFSWFDGLNILLMCLLVYIMAYPFLHMGAVSLSSNVQVLQGNVSLWPKGFTLDTYKIVLSDERIGRAYINTIFYVILGTSLSLMVTSMGAFSLSRKQLPYRRILSFLIVFTMLFNAGMIPSYLVIKSYGLLNTVWAMVLPYMVAAYNFFVMKTFFQNMPEELFECGKVDGLTDLGLFARICLPLSKPVMATIGLFYAVFVWNNFVGPLLYIRDEALWPLQMILRHIVFFSGFKADEMMGDTDVIAVGESLQYATILVSTLPILCLYPFIQKYFVKGALLGSLKG